MSELQIKLEAIQEYRDAVTYKVLNEELANSLLGLLGEVSRHYEGLGKELPESVRRIMQKTADAFDARINASQVEPKSIRTD